jgi:hypothetical protein
MLSQYIFDICKKKKMFLNNNTYTFNSSSNRFHISSSDFNKMINSTNTLFIVSHDYSYIDVCGICDIVEYIKAKNYIIAGSRDRFWINIAETIGKLFDKKTKLLFTASGNRVVNLSTDLLKKNNNVFIYTWKNNKKSGMFNIAKISNCNVVFIKIKKRYNNIKKIIDLSEIKLKMICDRFTFHNNSDFDIKLEEFNDPLTDNSDFLEKVKKILYSDDS